MATVQRSRKRRLIVKGIQHGLGGYTNHGCRCNTCTESNSEHSRKYRNRRFAGSPLCVVPKCPWLQSRAYGNGLCQSHARMAVDFRQEMEQMTRLQLRRLIRKLDLGIKATKRYTDDDLRVAIEEQLGAVGMVKAGS